MGCEQEAGVYEMSDVICVGYSNRVGNIFSTDVLQGFQVFGPRGGEVRRELASAAGMMMEEANRHLQVSAGKALVTGSLTGQPGLWCDPITKP